MLFEGGVRVSEKSFGYQFVLSVTVVASGSIWIKSHEHC